MFWQQEKCHYFTLSAIAVLFLRCVAVTPAWWRCLGEAGGLSRPDKLGGQTFPPKKFAAVSKSTWPRAALKWRPPPSPPSIFGVSRLSIMRQWSQLGSSGSEAWVWTWLLASAWPFAGQAQPSWKVWQHLETLRQPSDPAADLATAIRCWSARALRFYPSHQASRKVRCILHSTFYPRTSPRFR